MFGVVVHEHVVRHGQELTLDTRHRGDDHLEPSHVPGVARVLQTVLVTLEEELQEESATHRH